jgi:hypothetical protein
LAIGDSTKGERQKRAHMEKLATALIVAVGFAAGILTTECAELVK